MRNTQGYLVISGDAGVISENDTFTCAHCNNIVIVPNKGTPPGGFCQLCNKLVCDACSTKGCIPFEKKLEEMEARDRFHRSIAYLCQ